MRNLRNHIVFLVLAALMLGCTDKGTLPEEGKGESLVSQPADTLYTEKAAMDVYASQPERALQIIDFFSNNLSFRPTICLKAPNHLSALRARSFFILLLRPISNNHLIQQKE